METITQIQTLRERVALWRQKGQRISLVPTMGNLHKGHVSLVTQAKAHADRVVVSAFVNPLQFGPSEDYDAYPRTPQEDMQALTEVQADAMFHPDVSEIYPAGHEHGTRVDVLALSGILCGAFRPGHFTGVATVVTKLLNIVQPDIAIFGEKDYQQLVIVRRLVADLCMPVRILAGATVRDIDGLALSSRNRYLSPAERSVAPKLYETLQTAKQRILNGEGTYEAIQQAGRRALEESGFKPEYLEIRESADLQPARESSKELIVLAAVHLGKTRLIDNLRVSVQ